MTDYVVKNQYGCITVQDARTINEPKTIRFIDSHYRDKFRIPDGEQILISYRNGEKETFTCKYLDDYHLMVGFRAYHICELAERMESIGARISPFPEKRMIWSNRNLDLKDWRADIGENYPDISRDEMYDKMVELNASYLDDERVNLDIPCGDDIIAIGDLGRWNGRFSGYKTFESGNIKDCLYSECELCEWYVDREGEFRSTQSHHDGTNYIYYRKFREDASWDDRNNLLEDIYEGVATQEQIDRLTEKLGPAIAEVYGWEFPTPKKEQNRNRESR